MALIYIVEDDKNISEIESFSLKNAGHQTVEFPDGRSFYKELAEKKPDLILLDIMLPDEDGLSILRKIREKRETKRIPVIMVTAKTTEIDKVKGLDNGADDYMTKPFGVMELVSRVKALLRIWRRIRRSCFPETALWSISGMQTVRLNRARSMCISRHCVISLEMQENILKPYGMSGTA